MSLGKLRDGEEWFAFTFVHQAEFPLRFEELEDILAHSDQIAKDAYERMTLNENHHWARHTDKEIKFIEENLNISPDANIVDFGCGTGRHTLALARQKYSVTGIDFVEKFINAARTRAKEGDINTATFISGDCRTYVFSKQFDAGICLYDVIGTFPKQADNLNILINLAKSIKNGGYILCSVLNMTLTISIAKYKADVQQNPNALLRLSPSKTMQNTGNIFNPDYFLLDEADGVIYRKEQFDLGKQMPRQVIVRDRRYSDENIKNMCEQSGLRLIWLRHVQAGHWDIALSATDLRAKEILFLAHKNS